MVASRPVSISATAGVVARDYDNNLNKAANKAEKEALAAAPDAVLSVSTVNDRHAAEELHKHIEGWTADLEKARDTKDAGPDDIKVNEVAMHSLEEYMGALQTEDLGLSNFKTLYKRVQVDYARLDAMAQKAGAGLTDRNQMAAQSGQQGTNAVNAETGAGLGNDHLDNIAGQNNGGEALAARAEKIANTPGNDKIKQMLLAAQNDKAPLDEAQAAVTTAQGQSVSAMMGLNGAGDQLKGLETKIKSKQLKQQFEAAKKEIDENKERVAKVCEVLSTAIEAASGNPEEAAKTIGLKAVEMLGPVVATALGLPGLTMSAEDAKAGEDADIKADMAVKAEYDGLKNVYIEKTRNAKDNAGNFMNQLAQLDKAKKDHKNSLMQLGAALDDAEAHAPGAKKRNPGELGPFQTLTAFLSEADAFIADAQTALDVGQKELSAGVDASAAQNLRSRRSDAESLVVHIPAATTGKDESGQPVTHWHVASQTVKLDSSGKGSAEDSSMQQSDGANSTAQEGCKAIEKFIEEIKGYREQLRKGLDFGAQP
jgi:hypothetical protein